MSRVRADNYTNRAGTGAPLFTNGINVTGVVTATNFVGNGSQLSGVISGVQIRDEGSIVGSAITSINFTGDITAVSSGSASTITVSAASDITSSLFS